MNGAVDVATDIANEMFEGFTGRSLKSGFNKENIEAIGLDVIDTYRRVREIVKKLLEDNLVIPMSTNWYAPEAVKEFGYIKSSVRDLGKDLNEAYVGFNKWLQQAGENWVKNTSGASMSIPENDTHNIAVANYWYGKSHNPQVQMPTPQEIDLNISSIKEKDDSNNIYLNENKAYTVAESMDSLKKTVLQKIRAEHEKLNAKTALLGHGQGRAATACFVRIAELIGTFFDKLLETLSKRLHEYAFKYRRVAEGISNEFQNANLNVESSEQ